MEKRRAVKRSSKNDNTLHNLAAVRSVLSTFLILSVVCESLKSKTV